ncbi:hypothetical protein [Microbulbifer sp. SSSA005]|uniref:hypothetical protein n=1 Tax=unclassified Microbulbifer TaxID=2619833 RepID=UPI004039279D
MKKISIFLIIFLFSVKLHAIGDYSQLSERGVKAIDLCLVEYTRIKGNVFPEDIDRAYVYVGKNMMGVLFTRGEIGTFGKRSTSYQAFVSCGVSLHPRLQVRDLMDGYSVLKGADITTEEPDLRNEHVDELLYFRNGMAFSFSKGQTFSPKKIDKLQLP